MSDKPDSTDGGQPEYSLFDNEERILAETEALFRRLETMAREGAAPAAQSVPAG